MHIRRIALLLTPMLLAAATPAEVHAAQASLAVQTGMEVRHTSGALVGTVQRAERDHVVVKTDRHEARLPRSSFTGHAGHLLIALTRDQLNASVEEILAQAASQIVVGATVRGPGGATVGTIESLGEAFVTIKLASGALVRIPRSAIAPGSNGPIVGASGADLEAAAAKAG